jgi:hypothetical protein
MSLSEYFENVDGIGILSTADTDGNVDSAIYARPHVVDENTVDFIMGDHLSHDNVASNPHAAYLFVEGGEGYRGRRLHLTKIRQESDPAKIAAVGRRPFSPACLGDGDKQYLVSFHVDLVRELSDTDPRA